MEGKRVREGEREGGEGGRGEGERPDMTLTMISLKEEIWWK